MVTLDRIRLTGLLRRKPRKRGFLYCALRAIDSYCFKMYSGRTYRKPLEELHVSRLTDVTAAELRERLGDPTLTIVDVRGLPAYNGWRPNGEARGGHIPGAVAFPS